RWATLKPPDLVILDLGLPHMDGAEVLERLRAWSSVPLIVLSVRSNEAEKVRLLESGADDYVVKPFGMAELLARAAAATRPPPARARLHRRAGGQGRAARDRPCRTHRDHQRRACDAHPEGISAAATAGAARRQRRHLPVPAQGSVGVAAPARYALSAHLRAQA